MVISASTNTTANTALRYLSQNSAASASSLAKLSSGSRIVKASDDAASLAIGTKIKADVTALKQAQVNASQASSVLQVADGALSQTTDILMRMKALSVQAQSGSVSDTERGFLDKEFQALTKQIDSIAEQTKFNGNTLLGGAFANSITAQEATPTAGDPTNLTNANGITAAMISLDGSADFAPSTWQITSVASVQDADPADQVAGSITLTNANDPSQTQTVVMASTASAVAGDAAFTGTLEFDQLGISLDLTAYASGTAIDAADATTRQFTVADNAMSFQVGVAASDTIGINLSDTRAAALGVSTASVGTAEDAVAAGDMIDNAISAMNTARADIGAGISRFEFASANVANTIENMDAARSVLMDVDMAAEMSNFSSKQVMLQASVAMLAQANQQPQQLLRLLN